MSHCLLPTQLRCCLGTCNGRKPLLKETVLDVRGTRGSEGGPGRLWEAPVTLCHSRCRGWVRVIAPGSVTGLLQG